MKFLKINHLTIRALHVALNNEVEKNLARTAIKINKTYNLFEYFVKRKRNNTN